MEIKDISRKVSCSIGDIKVFIEINYEKKTIILEPSCRDTFKFFNSDPMLAARVVETMRQAVEYAKQELAVRNITRAQRNVEERDE